MEYTTNDKENYTSKIIIDITINLAIIYSETEFYLPVFSDWRGRIYPESSFLNYQANELSFSLISPFEGKVLDDVGLRYFLIHGANCYGIDNYNFDEIINWVINNANSIINLDLDFLIIAKQPINFLNFALYLRKWYINPNEPLNFFAVQDATCSGLQHIASIMSDKSLAKMVNLVPYNNPSDIYTIIANNLEKSLSNISPFNKLNIDRKFIKKSIMTIPYGVTIIGMVNQIAENAISFNKSNKTYCFLSKNNNVISLSRKELFTLVQFILSELNKDYASIHILKYF
ncbi:DNA-directed RNA polymerase [Clydaea vesicula]|uniref:DNA-directed RNA polymerase n=1 Tax=Clydaea vesicula TaxID=447962 RepID=A0AAD5XYA3_9FUNG|nr:DNA-directed RNA polymerase [Clydaea vesicula]